MKPLRPIRQLREGTEMTGFKKLLIGLISVAVIFAIKPHYGGNITIRLNEPASFSFTPSNYSNMIFYSLIYENFFYLKKNGQVWSNIFKEYQYDRSQKRLSLQLNPHLSTSKGDPIDSEGVRNSLQSFLNQNFLSAKELRSIIKNVRSQNDTIYIELLYDRPDIVNLLTVPELVLLGGESHSFTGIFYPAEWVKNEYVVLSANPFYPGGRTYLDSVKVLFYDHQYPDVFLSNPGGFGDYQYQELNAGIYQNVYIIFPGEEVGQNTRIALYSLLKQYYDFLKLPGLSSLTSEEESPVSINIKTIPSRRMRSILRYSKINLYILSSLKDMEESFNDFLQRKGVSIQRIYIGDNQLLGFVRDGTIKYLLLEKVFRRRTPLEAKISRIIKEMTFSRFSEKYLKLMDELEEIRNLNNEELLMEQVAKIIETIIQDGFLLPLYQKKISLYVKGTLKGIEMDYYGRPLFQKVGVK